MPVNDLDALAAAWVEAAFWRTYLSDSPSAGMFVFTRATGTDGVGICARMFAPEHGIPEDPATGSAVAALAGWLAEHDSPSDGSVHWAANQGIEMGRPSRLNLAVDIENREIRAVRVSGCSVSVSHDAITVPRGL